MKKSLQLQQERGVLDEKRNGILAKIEERADKTATDDEMKELKEIRSQIADLDKKIADALFIEEEQRSYAQGQAEQRFHINKDRNTEGEGGEKRKHARELRIVPILRSMQPGVAPKLDGLALELHQEGEKEARESGCETLGTGFIIPGYIRDTERRAVEAEIERRASSVGTSSAGGYTVATDLGGLIPVLEPNLVTQALGAQVMAGLVGNLDLPKQTAYSAAVWETETSSADDTGPTFGKVSLVPNRLAAKTDFSMQLLRQSSIGIENLLRRDLTRATEIKVDAGVINGTGSGQMNGILTWLLTANKVVGGTNGLAPTYDHIIDLESLVNVQNALMGNLAYLTTPGVKGKLKKTKIDAGSGQFVWGQDAATLNGYRAETSTQVPSTLDKGTSTGVCHAIIFGDWSQYLIGQWGPVEILVDPYTQALTGQIRIVMNSFWDGDSRYYESFSAMIDALIS